MSRRIPLFVLCALLSLWAATVRAQEEQVNGRGFKPDKVYEVGDLDSINLFNGNLTLTIPIGQRYPVSENFSYGLTLVYNSLAWDFQERFDVPDQEIYTSPVPSAISNAGLGWTLSLGMLFPPASGPQNLLKSWKYVGPDGASHLFYDELHYNCTGCLDGSSTTHYTRDGTYLRMRQVGGDWEIDFPDGQIHRFVDYGVAPAEDWRLEEISDPFGNSLLVTYGAQTWTLTDSHGRTQTVSFQDDPELGQVVDSVTVEAFGAQTATYSFSYGTSGESTNVQRCYRNFDPDVLSSSTVSVPLLTEILLPDGTAYRMLDDAAGVPDYHTDCGTGTDIVAGAIRGLELPTLGRVEWDYGRYWMPNLRPNLAGEDPIVALELVSGVRERRQVDRDGTGLGTTEYHNEFVNNSAPFPDNRPVETRTYVIHPSGDPASPHCTKHYFRADVQGDWRFGLPFTLLEPQAGFSPTLYDLSTEVWDGSEPGPGVAEQVCSGTKLRSSYVRYEYDLGNAVNDGDTGRS